jgi:hypothetical protein
LSPLVVALLISALAETMTASQIGSLADAAIPAVIGVLVVLFRGTMLAKITNPEKHARAKKIYALVPPILIVSALLIGIASFRPTAMSDVLADAVAQINAKSPRMIDETTRIEGASVEDGRRLVCRVTFTTYTREAFDMKVWEEQAVPLIREQLLATSAIQAARKEGITTVYRYSGSDGVLIGDVVIEPEKK